MPEQPADLSPSDAVEWYLDHRRASSSDQTMQSYQYRLQQFVEWCDDQDIDRVGDLNGFTLERFFRHRRSELAAVSLKGQMSSLRMFIRYLERIEAVDEGLAEKIDVPTISRDQETSDVMLEAADAKQLIGYYRNSAAERATPRHVVLEIFWNTGCRLGGLRGLDLADYHSDEQYLSFQHRPEEGTPLKNDLEGQRTVAISEAVANVLDHYIARERFDRRDEFGREPLLSGRQGRPSPTSIRAWSYLSTQPCVHMRCPHGYEKRTCDFRERGAASKCPSSRSPHHIRTGSITWHLDRGIPLEVVAERVNAAPETIKQHYDKASNLQKLEQRRKQYTENLDIDHDDE